MNDTADHTGPDLPEGQWDAPNVTGMFCYVRPSPDNPGHKRLALARVGHRLEDARWVDMTATETAELAALLLNTRTG